MYNLSFKEVCWLRKDERLAQCPKAEPGERIKDARSEVSHEGPDKSLRQYNPGRRVSIRNWSFIPKMWNQSGGSQTNQRVEIRDSKSQLREEIQGQVPSSEAKGGAHSCFVHPSVFTELLLCARHSSRPWDTAMNKTKPLPSHSSHSRRQEINIIIRKQTRQPARDKGLEEN